MMKGRLAGNMDEAECKPGLELMTVNEEPRRAEVADYTLT